MLGTPHLLGGIESRIQTLESYSELQSASARVLVPANLDELKRIFRFATDNGSRVTLRAGGHSFDAQSLGEDLVVSMERFNRITVDKAAEQVHVEAGTTWGEILRNLKGHDLVVAGTVTTSHATVGGTVAADCLSRFSAAYGKDGARVKRFSLLTPEGKVLECRAPAAGIAPTTDEERAFLGTIGGFGYLGAILEITISVHAVDPPIRVRTTVQASGSFANLARDLVPRATMMARTGGRPADPNDDALSAGLYPLGSGRPSAVLFTSRFVTTPRRRRFLMYRPGNPLRILTEWLMRVPLLCRGLSVCYWCYYSFIAKDREYFDDLEGFSFFMDANARAKQIAKRFGRGQPTVQQTFFVPANAGATETSPGQAQDRDAQVQEAQDRLVQWLEAANDLLRLHGLTPTLQDVLFLKEDLPFYLSPNPGQEGFAVSYAFETSNEDTIRRVEQAFSELTDTLWYRFAGRVSLVKNVCADASVLRHMYRDGAAEFLALKARLDPQGILRNEFFERVLA